jgi:hypothetical protein
VSRISIAAAATLLLLALAAFGSGPRGNALLTPLPNGPVVVTLVGAIALGIALAAALAPNVPGRLPRRLAVIAILAGTLYASGQAARGAYATWVFSGDVATDVRTFLVTGGSGSVLWVVDPTRMGRSLGVPAAPALVASPPRGQCVSVRVERSPGGAERFAPAAPIGPGDLGRCADQRR